MNGSFIPDDRDALVVGASRGIGLALAGGLLKSAAERDANGRVFATYRGTPRRRPYRPWLKRSAHGSSRCPASWMTIPLLRRWPGAWLKQMPHSV